MAPWALPAAQLHADKSRTKRLNFAPKCRCTIEIHCTSHSEAVLSSFCIHSLEYHVRRYAPKWFPHGVKR
jgi:hypothetical protein